MVKFADFIIVGQGIAGSLFSYHLAKANKHIHLIDSPNPLSASKVAAGLWNPTVFKRLGKSWKADFFIPELELLYPELELKTQARFFYPKAYKKVFSSIDEVNNWESKNGDERFSSFFGTVSAQEPDSINAENGAGNVLHAGYLDTIPFIEGMHNWFKDQENVNCVEHHLKEEEVSFEQNLVTIQCGDQIVQAPKIIFANGLEARNFSFFNWVPFTPVKGEVLTIKCTQLDVDEIVNKGFFIVPIDKDLYRVGATYEHHDIFTGPSEKGKKTLTDKLNALLKVPYEIVDHKAGVRPAVKERKPLIGQHPEKEQLFLFNGMGSKAVMMAPLLSLQFANHLLYNEEIWPEVNLSRFYDYYSAQ